MKKTNETMNENNIIYFSTRDELTRVNLAEVIYFESNGNYIRMVSVSNIVTNLLTSMTSLAEVFNAMKSLQFIRVGKSHYINKEYLYKINILRKQLLLRGLPGQPLIPIPVSKESLRELKQKISSEPHALIEEFKPNNGKMQVFYEKR